MEDRTVALRRNLLRINLTPSSNIHICWVLVFVFCLVVVVFNVNILCGVFLLEMCSLLLA